MSNLHPGDMGRDIYCHENARRPLDSTWIARPRLFAACQEIGSIRQFPSRFFIQVLAAPDDLNEWVNRNLLALERETIIVRGQFPNRPREKQRSWAGPLRITQERTVGTCLPHPMAG
jgi:hypothetical protein